MSSLFQPKVSYRSAMEILPTNSQLESTAEPVKVQLALPEAGESDNTAEVKPQIIPAIVEESPTQFEEDRPVLQVGQLLLLHFYLLTVYP